MNVSHSNIDNLNAIISIELEKPDYEEKVNKSLRTYGNRANIPGFRKGHVPFSMLVKMFGKAVKAEEINRLVSESLYNYIRDNKLDILGEPMTAEDMTVDLDAQDDFTFRFDVALAPELNVKVDKSISVPYYTITVDDDMVKRQDESFRARFGKQQGVPVRIVFNQAAAFIECVAGVDFIPLCFAQPFQARVAAGFFAGRNQKNNIAFGCQAGVLYLCKQGQVHGRIIFGVGGPQAVNSSVLYGGCKRGKGPAFAGGLRIQVGNKQQGLGLRVGAFDARQQIGRAFARGQKIPVYAVFVQLFINVAHGGGFVRLRLGRVNMNQVNQVLARVGVQ